MMLKHTNCGYYFVLSIFLAHLSACSCDSDSDPNPTDGDGGDNEEGGNSIISSDSSTLGDGPMVIGLTPHDEGDPIEGWVLGECTIVPVADPFENPSTELHWRGTDLPFPTYEQVINTPIVVDFVPEPEGEDMVPEIAFIGYVTFNGDGVLRVVHGRPPYTNLLTFTGDGSPAIAHPNTDPGTADPNLLFDAHPAAGDLNGDGHAEIVAVQEDNHLVAFTYDVPSQTFIELWTTSFAVGNGNPSVAIANIDQTGDPEIVVGRTVVNADGTQRWVGSGANGTNDGGPLTCVADIVTDPSAPGMEVIAGATVYGSDGTPLWTPPGGEGFCAVGDLLNNDTMATGKDGSPEFVRVSDSRVYVHDPRLASEGAVLWQVDVPQCDYDTGAFTCTQDCDTADNSVGAPTIADFDGDGNAEIGVAGGTCYVVIDPDCRGGSVPGCALDGVLWAHPTNDGSSNVTSSTVFDFNGDGKAEVIYNDQDRFLVLDGQTGAEVFVNWNPSRTRTEQPAIADVDNDGNAEIVFVANTEAVFAGTKIPSDIRDLERIPGVEIWSSGDDAWVGARKIWNQHTYHIDNINEDGTVPLEEAASWLTHNSYRLNAPVGDQLVSPDLGAAGAGVRCSSGIIYVCAQLLNSGDVLVGPGMEVSFYTDDASGMLIGTTETVRNVLPGTYGESLCVPWNPVTHPAVSNIYVEIDPNSNTRECHEDNNSLSFSAGIPSCGTI